MTDGLLLDTHTVIWYLAEPDKLSQTASLAIDSAFDTGIPLYISAICLVEIVYLCEKGRIPEAAAESIIETLTGGGAFSIVPLDEAVARTLAGIPRYSVPDMPDRIIAATGRLLNVPIVTKDSLLRSSRAVTIW